jgi:hypothetical protein
MPSWIPDRDTEWAEMIERDDQYAAGWKRARKTALKIETFRNSNLISVIEKKNYGETTRCLLSLCDRGTIDPDMRQGVSSMADRGQQEKSHVTDRNTKKSCVIMRTEMWINGILYGLIGMFGYAMFLVSWFAKQLSQDPRVKMQYSSE